RPRPRADRLMRSVIGGLFVALLAAEPALAGSILYVVEPVERVCDEKIADFIASEVKNERAPIQLLALARVHVLVKIGAIEFGQTMRILRKMRRDPIHNHADPSLMTAVDKMPKLVRFSEAAGRRVIISDLITPGTFEGMLRHRH